MAQASLLSELGSTITMGLTFSVGPDRWHWCCCCAAVCRCGRVQVTGSNGVLQRSALAQHEARPMAQRIVQPSLLLKCDQALVQDAGAARFLSSHCVGQMQECCHLFIEFSNQAAGSGGAYRKFRTCIMHGGLCYMRVLRALISSKVCFTGLMLVSCISCKTHSC